jgi:hypothetical protein
MIFKLIVDLVAQSYGLAPEEILGKRRTKEIADARQLVCFLAREKNKESFPEIARNFGNYDHTTALYSYRKVVSRISNSIEFKNFVEKISQAIDENSPIIKINKPDIKKLEENHKHEHGKEGVIDDNARLHRMFKNKPHNLDRWMSILDKYRSGLTLQEIGEVYSLTRERIRQIVMRALSYEAYKIFNKGIDLDLTLFIRKNLEEHTLRFKKRKPTASKPAEIVKKEPSWSQNYNRCRMCGTNSVKHKGYGYCKWCYFKSNEFKKRQRESWLRNKEKRKKYNQKYSIEYLSRPEVKAKMRKRADLKMFGGNREKALKRDGYRCKVCGMSQAESFNKFGRDLYIAHINGVNNHSLENLITRCINCHNSAMIKIMQQRLKEAKL